MDAIPLTEKNPLRWPRYIFFRLAEWGRAHGGDMPLLNALLLVGFLLNMNLSTIEGATSSVCKPCDIFWPMLNQLDFQGRRIVLSIVVFGLFGVLYLRWIHLDQYKQFFAVYRAESEANRRAGSVLVGGYIVGSILLYGLTFLLV